MTSFCSFLNSGADQLARAILSGEGVIATSFRVGEDDGTTLTQDFTVTGPLPTSVYTGTQAQIVGTQLTAKTMRFVLEIPDSAGTFDIGNVVLYMTDAVLGSVPFLQYVLPTAETKYPAGAPYYGSSMVINIMATIQDSNQAFVTPTVTTPIVAQLPTVLNEAALPSPSSGTWQTLMLQQSSVATRPTLVMRRVSDNTYYGNPFYQDISSAYFGMIYGGVVGTGYGP